MERIARDINYPGGCRVKSYSLLDQGRGPLSSFSIEENIDRKNANYICFIESIDDSVLGNCDRICFAPEFPNARFGDMHAVMTFYVMQFGFGNKETYLEIAAFENAFRIYDWNKGVDFVKNLDPSKLNNAQMECIDLIVQIDRESKKLNPIPPSLSRERLGPPWGARFSLNPLFNGFG